ncbi:ATPase [Clostridia bacterium]|nr:ATPase [Clostridia bacterium]
MDTIERFQPSAASGLTDEQATRRFEQGLFNRKRQKITKSNGDIFKDNVLTLFNLYNLIIGICLVSIGAYLNTAYLAIILINTAIGIVQEVRARNLVNKLSLLTAQTVRVVRGGAIREIPAEEVVLDDVLSFEAGNQICADCVLLDGEAEVNEALLTGEADAVTKTPRSLLLSGSFIAGGRCRARAERVGAESFAAKLAEEAKKHKKIKSEILTSMRKVTRLTGYFILPVAVLLFTEAYFIRAGTLSDSVVSTAAAVLGMLPKGLVLLVSIALAVGVAALARKKVLVQEMHAIEMFAHADVLCLDKTGTLTEGKMKVSGLTVAQVLAPPMSAEQALALFVSASEDNNATYDALKAYFTGAPDSAYTTAAKTPFSSERKWSSVTFKGYGTIVVGAPEKLLARHGGPLPEELAAARAADKRTLYAAYAAELPVGGALPSLKIFAAIELTDPVRPSAARTLAYFKREGVDIKVISGDDPRTVSAVAKEAGLEKYAAFIDMTGVDTAEEIREAAERYAVFGRVTPAQKQRLVAALKEGGHTVAMTGDGVNDVLALREADCGIALASGADAARQVSQIVLTDSDFTALPDVLAEGRRVVNNITKVSGVFFIKTLYSALLSLFCIAFNVPFPFLPIQITLIDLAIEGYPSLIMSFERETGQIRGTFLRTAVTRALPFAVLITVYVAALTAVGRFTHIEEAEIAAVMYLIAGFVSAIAVFRACMPFNKLRLFLALTSGLGFFAAVWLLSSGVLFSKNLLGLTLPGLPSLWFFIAFAALAVPLCLLLARLTRKLSKRSAAADRKSGSNGL